MWVLILNDGTALIPMRDPEGNGPGHLDIAETAPHTVIDAAADDAN